MHVLVVDDDPSVRGVLRLGLLGHDVVEAADGLEALAALEAGPFDVVLLDLMMPHLDGYDVLSAIRRRHGESVAVVVLTGRAAEHDHVAAFRLGADGYLTKPFDVDAILAQVEASAGQDAATRRRLRRDELARAEFLARLEDGLAFPVD